MQLRYHLEPPASHIEDTHLNSSFPAYHILGQLNTDSILDPPAVLLGVTSLRDNCATEPGITRNVNVLYGVLPHSEIFISIVWSEGDGEIHLDQMELM